MLITTEAVVAEIPEEHTHENPIPGGMDGMM